MWNKNVFVFLHITVAISLSLMSSTPWLTDKICNYVTPPNKLIFHKLSGYIIRKDISKITIVPVSPNKKSFQRIKLFTDYFKVKNPLWPSYSSPRLSHSFFVYWYWFFVWRDLALLCRGESFHWTLFWNQLKLRSCLSLFIFKTGSVIKCRE